MAVSINLLPQERQDKLRDKRNRNLAVGLAVVVNGGLIGIMIVMFVISQAQALALNRLQSDIDSKITQFKETPNVVDMLTLQQNLKAVPSLYANRRIVSRFFSVLEKVDPRDIVISQLNTDETGRVSVSGTASQMRLITKLARALESRSDRFTNVELGAVTQSSGGRATFTMSFSVASSVTAVGEQP